MSIKVLYKKNALPEENSDGYLVKYYVTVEDVIEKSAGSLSRLGNYHIWTNSHVRDYVPKKGYVWLLRAYKLDEPVFAKRSRGMVYANVDKEICVDDLEPVLSDQEFEDLRGSIL